MSGELTPSALVSRLADVTARIAELTEEAEGIKATLRSYGAGQYDGFKVTPGRRFNVEKAYALVPDNLKRDCLTVEIDPDAVKSHLTPAQRESCMDEHGKAKVTLG